MTGHLPGHDLTGEDLTRDDRPNLLAVPSAWVQLLDDTDGLTVLELDEAVVDAAPWAGFGVQLAVSVTVQEPDLAGQPYDQEHVALGALQWALEQALEGHGRLVASITLDGVRELVAYVDSIALVQAWRTQPPEGFASHDVQVQLLEDPQWRGLREIAGQLGEDPVLRPPTAT